MKAKFFTFDDEMDSVIDSLEMAAEFVKRMQNDPSKSKWLSFTLYHALHISCISALNLSNPDTVIEAKRRRLFSFSKALELVQDSHRMKQYTFSKPVKLTPEQKESLNKLQDYRDVHWHMKPMGIIEATLKPKVIKDTIDVIEYLIFQSGNIQIYEEDRKRKMEYVLKEIRELIKE